MRGAARLLPFLLCAIPAPTPVYAQWTGTPDAGQAELRIVDLSLRDRQTVASDMLAWQATGGTLYLPFAEVMDVIGFRIEVGPAGADGWFLRETQKFRLDRETALVEVAGRRHDLRPDDIAQIDGVAHVSSLALDRWFSLGVKWSPDQQVVSLTPPYMLANEEMARRGGGGGIAEDADYSGYARSASGPGWISWPYLTANLGIAAQSRNGQAFTSQDSLLAQGDLLGTSAQLVLSGNTPGRFDGRLTVMRQDPDARLLGPLGASYVQAGDIALQGMPLLLRNGNGVGAQISRGRLNAAGRFDQTDLVGGAPPGWQAELYRDNQLLGFQTIGSDGRYNFPATPLQFGGNRFRIQLYGPSGERQTIMRSYDIASDLIPPGSFTYAFAAIKQGRALFRRSLFDIDTGIPPGGSVDVDQARESALLFNPRGLHAQMQMGYGLTRALSVNAIVARREEEGGIDATYTGAGLGWRFGSALVSADILQQSGGGQAARGALLAGLWGTSLTLEYEIYGEDFLSDENRIAPDVTTLSRGTVMLDGRIGEAGWNLSLTQNRRSDGASDSFGALRANMVVGALSVTPRVTYRDISLGDGQRDRRLDGGLAIAGAIGNWRLRANADIDFVPRTRFRTLGADVSLRLTEWYLSAAIDRDFMQPSTRARLAVNRDWNGLRLGTEGRYDAATRSFAGFLTLAIAVDRAPDGGAIRLGREARGNNGTLIARIFDDRNGDGHYGDGDVLVPDADVVTAPRGQTRRTPYGIVVDSLPIDRVIAIAPDLSSIDTPYLTPVVPGRRVTVRGGGVTHVDLPLVATGEVEIMLRDSAGEAIAGKIVTLTPCTESGTGSGAERRVRSAFDGRAIADGVMIGCYAVSQGRDRLGVIEVAAEQVTSAVMILPAALASE